MREKDKEVAVVPGNKEGGVGFGKEGLAEAKRESSLEVESVIEKLERQTRVDNQNQDQNGDINAGTVVSASDDQPAVTLPLTQNDMTQGQKMSVWESLRWLAEWAVRQVKKFHGRVEYHQEEDERS